MGIEFPTIKTDRLILRQFSASDLENVYKGLSDPEVTKYYGVHFDTLEETKKQLAWFEEIEKNGTGVWWAISSSDQSVFYGAVGLYFLKKEHKKAEIGFWLLPEYWGKGLLAQIMPLVLEYGFDIMQLHRIEGFVESENSGSGKLMKKLRFVPEGTMVDCEIKNGRYICLDIYAMLNPKSS